MTFQNDSSQSGPDSKVELESTALIFRKLMQVIESRNRLRPENSYVARLLEGGSEKIGDKIREEVEEVLDAAQQHSSENSQALVHEVADLIFHTLVLMGWAEVSIDQLEAELNRRFGISGLEEKQSRPNKKNS